MLEGHPSCSLQIIRCLHICIQEVYMFKLSQKKIETPDLYSRVLRMGHIIAVRIFVTFLSREVTVFHAVIRAWNCAILLKIKRFDSILLII